MDKELAAYAGLVAPRLTNAEIIQSIAKESTTVYRVTCTAEYQPAGGWRLYDLKFYEEPAARLHAAAPFFSVYSVRQATKVAPRLYASLDSVLHDIQRMLKRAYQAQAPGGGISIDVRDLSK